MQDQKYIDEELRKVFDMLEESFTATGVDFYLIGAQARNAWYSKGNIIAGSTKDADFAVLINNESDYDTVKKYLVSRYGFTESKQNAFVMLSPGGLPVDLLPFGAIEIDHVIVRHHNGLNNINVNGFNEVYKKGTEMMRMNTGHEFVVASLSSIVLLKLIAFDDRPEQRQKDALDIDGIFTHYFELQSDVIYKDHIVIFEDESLQQAEVSLNEISAIVIGREMKKIISNNEELTARINGILDRHILERENSLFVKGMLVNSEDTVENKLKLLENVRRGFND
jgi:predicted nucleotidyltransferase